MPARFDQAPFGSASIAQVHHARLHSGEHVVVDRCDWLNGKGTVDPHLPARPVPACG
jgi:hypothetical protein